MAIFEVRGAKNGHKTAAQVFFDVTLFLISDALENAVCNVPRCQRNVTYRPRQLLRVSVGEEAATITVK
ncbi:hypothetical protein DD559_13485 [Sphingomonas pokkalii]|uniref:Uncharacterized protein n=1 Tax=Sphingomonas pokkalii TaxID=2175090 RepID=A0A2U0SFS9_9SPHN|nr:hypothetical protein DD559_13485 [Sphingomonas pokkalii]